MKETLNTVNRIRVAFGKEKLTKLPKGQAHSSYYCPIANALKEIGLNSAGYYLMFDAQVINKVADVLGVMVNPLISYVIIAPDECAEFVHRFDKGTWKSYHLKEKE